MILALALVHAAATLFLAGLVWFVQVVHYPLFALAGLGPFRAFEREHVRRTGLVVAPAMLVELVAAVALVLPTGELRGPALAGLALLAVVWLSTALLQVPCHRRLERGFDGAVVRRLVSTNWIRTLAWTLRAMLALWLVVLAGS